MKCSKCIFVTASKDDLAEHITRNHMSGINITVAAEDKRLQSPSASGKSNETQGMLSGASALPRPPDINMALFNPGNSLTPLTPPPNIQLPQPNPETSGNSSEHDSLSTSLPLDSKHQGRFQCEFCIYASPHASALSKHVRAVHEKIRDHHCPFCDYAAALKV
jgi:hypothetical protein